MIEILNYKLSDTSVYVKLKCHCGEQKIMECIEGAETVLRCSKCLAHRKLSDLRGEASGYWRNRKWQLETIPDRRRAERFEIDIPLTIEIKESSDAPAHCTFSGSLVSISVNGGLCLIDNFEERYFPELSDTHREVVARPDQPPHGFPAELPARLVGIKYEKDTLPLCRFAISFKTTPADLKEQITAFIAKLKSTQAG